MSIAASPELLTVGQVFRSAPYLANMRDDKTFGRVADDYNRQAQPPGRYLHACH